jgi:SAM-dependent methyltransferase
MSLPPPTLFDPIQLRRQRLRTLPKLAQHDFLFKEAAQRLADRLLDVKRDFPLVLELGARGGLMAEALAGLPRIGRLISLDPHPAQPTSGALGLAADPEVLPLAPESVDLIVSCLSLHWINDLPGLLIQARRALKPGGLFLASLLGGGTLAELRQAFLLAESEVTGGAAPRVIPMAEIKDLGGLMQRARFDQPVADSEILTVEYAHPLNLLADLRGMGEGNALMERSRKPLSRAVLFRMAEIYQNRFAQPSGRVPARFEIITLTGWVPS